jgi:hypothetical protein
VKKVSQKRSVPLKTQPPPADSIYPAIVAAMILGVFLNSIVGNRIVWWFRGEHTLPFTLSGVATGTIAGLYTIWSRRRCGGRENLAHGLATSLLWLFVYLQSAYLFTFAYASLFQARTMPFNAFVPFQLLIYSWPAVWKYVLLLVPITFIFRFAVWEMYALRGGTIPKTSPD